MRAIRNVILRVVGVAGLILLSSFFAFTYSVPEWVENFGADFKKGKVSTEVDQAIDALKAPEGEGALAKIAKAIDDRNADKIAQLKGKLRESGARTVCERYSRDSRFRLRLSGETGTKN